MRFRPWLWTLVLTPCLLASRGPGTSGASALSEAPESPPRFNVVLITVDTLRADYLGCYGNSKVLTPALDGLAADGILFESAYCQVPLTPPSHACILTGTYPATHGLRDFTSSHLRPGAVTMASILRDKGYRTGAFVSAFVLDRSWGFSRGFDRYDDDFDLEAFRGVNPGNVQRRAGETMRRVLPWLEATRLPFFLWVHLYDPHHDYDPPSPFKERYSADPYAGEVAYTDFEIGKLLGALKALGAYRNSLIVATSDHGESLGEHGEEEHGFFLYESTVRIPLIIKLPSVYEVTRPRADGLAQTVDLLPTVLQVLRIPSQPEWKIEGRGLLSVILGKKSQDAFSYGETLYPRTTFGWSSLRTYRRGVYKFIDAPRAELYNLAADPQESRNLYASERARANQLRQEMKTLTSRFGSSNPAAHSEADAETLERLSALGYAAVSRPVPLAEAITLPDPKDKIEIYNRITKGLQASEAGRLRASNSIFEKVLKQDPRVFIVPYSMGLNYLKLRQPAEALEAFNRARELNPEFASIDANAARALSLLGRVPEAIELLRKVINAHPGRISAQRLLAGLYSRRGDFTQAIRIYRSILKERPADRQALKFLGIALVENQEYARGLESLSGAIGLGVDDALIRNSQGIALDNLGKPAEAVSSYRKALEFKSDYPQPRLNLAFALLKSGQREAAVQEFNQLCRISPQLCRRYRSQFSRPR
ncbi:MAG: sulfatase-like hydrolase/transferase [Acidobacteriota bacterium]